MKIRDMFVQRSKGISLEFFPPKSADGKNSFMDAVKDLKSYNPLYVSVTYGAGGSTQERTSQTLRWLKEETDLTLMSHLTCIGATEVFMEALLNDYMINGVDNILALRGDPPRNVPFFDQFGGDFRYAKDLVSFVRKFNYFSIAVAVYPEGHQESPSIEKDIEYTKKKVDAGADFCITQMFFDNKYFYDFRERAKKIGIDVPILPGIMPITDFRKIMEFANFCHATVPADIQKRLEPFLDTPDEVRKLGIEYTIRQCEDLIKNGVQYLHFYTMNRSDTVREILGALKIGV